MSHCPSHKLIFKANSIVLINILFPSQLLHHSNLKFITSGFQWLSQSDICCNNKVQLDMEIANFSTVKIFLNKFLNHLNSGFCWAKNILLEVSLSLQHGKMVTGKKFIFCIIYSLTYFRWIAKFKFSRNIWQKYGRDLEGFSCVGTFMVERWCNY